MLIDEFVDLRVRVGETERLEREREHARRAKEGGHGLWLAAMRREGRLARRVASTGSRAAAPADGAAGRSPVSTDEAAELRGASGTAPQEARRAERELARTAR